MIFFAEIWSDHLEGPCWILLNIYSFVTIIQRKTIMNLKRFPFSSSSVQIDEDLKTGLLRIAKCLKFEGRISFIHVGWLLRLFRLISWCWCRNNKNTSLMRFHLWQCGTSPGGCILHLTKKRVLFNHLCLMLKLSCEDPSFACHFWGLFANTSRIGAQPLRFNCLLNPAQIEAKISLLDWSTSRGREKDRFQWRQKTTNDMFGCLTMTCYQKLSCVIIFTRWAPTSYK